MPSKKERCRAWKLYIITDDAALRGGATLGDVVALAIRGGADVIQLRDKRTDDARLAETAKALLKITRPCGVPLIINDRIDVARVSGADGVHLGQEDASLEEARRELGEQCIIGRSTHSPEQALEAEKQGFDYIGVGPVFQTPTKPGYQPVGLDLVRFAAKHVRIPFVAIGGIDAANAKQVLAAGARTIAVVRAVMTAADAEHATRGLLEVFHV